MTKLDVLKLWIQVQLILTVVVKWQSAIRSPIVLIQAVPMMDAPSVIKATTWIQMVLVRPAMRLYRHVPRAVQPLGVIHALTKASFLMQMAYAFAITQTSQICCWTKRRVSVLARTDITCTPLLAVSSVIT